MQHVIKGHQIVVYGATSTCKNKGSMDPVHDEGFDGPGPWRGSMDQGSMFCTFPFNSPSFPLLCLLKSRLH